MEVALEPLPLGVAGLDDARARGAQLLEPRAHLGLEALVLEREPGGRGHLLDELLVVEEPGAWASTATGRPSRTRLVRAARASSTGRPWASTSRPRVVERVGEHELGVADDPGEHVAQAARRRRLRQLDDEPRDVGRARRRRAPSPRDAGATPTSAAAWPSQSRRSGVPFARSPAVERERERRATSAR